MQKSESIIGLDGVVTLDNAWDPYRQAYLSIDVPKLSNFFLYFGPNGAAGSGSASYLLENICGYMVQMR
jgi:cation diffusion facilitator CzcD-associated flavoprotein CzcO